MENMNFSNKLFIILNIIYYLIHLNYIESLNFHEENGKVYLYNLYKYRFKDEKPKENQHFTSKENQHFASKENQHFTNKVLKLLQQNSTVPFCHILFTSKNVSNSSNNLSDLDIMKSFLYKSRRNISENNLKNYNKYLINYRKFNPELLQNISHNIFYKKMFILPSSFDTIMKSNLFLINKVLKAQIYNKNKKGRNRSTNRHLKKDKSEGNKGRREVANNRKKEVKKRFIKLSRNDKLRNFLVELSNFDQFSGEEFIGLSPKEIWQFCQFFRSLRDLQQRASVSSKPFSSALDFYSSSSRDLKGNQFQEKTEKPFQETNKGKEKVLEETKKDEVSDQLDGEKEKENLERVKRSVTLFTGRWIEEESSGWTISNSWEDNDTIWTKGVKKDYENEIIISNDGGDDEDKESNCNCWKTTDYGSDTEVECRCLKWGSVGANPPKLDQRVQRITIHDAELEVLGRNSFQAYALTLQDIVLMEVSKLETVENGIFEDLINLRSVSIFNAQNLKSISNISLSEGLPKLRSLRVQRSGLEDIPDLIFGENSEIFTIIDLESNNIDRLRTRSIRIKAEQLVLNYNSISVIEEEAFYKSEIGKLSLKGNRLLNTLHPQAFANVRSLRSVDLSGTSITFLPTDGIEDIEELSLQDVPTLKVFPSVYSFKSIRKAHLTYPYHCCAFQFPQQHNPEVHRQHMIELKERQEKEHCQDSSASSLSITASNPSSSLTSMNNENKLFQSTSKTRISERDISTFQETINDEQISREKTQPRKMRHQFLKLKHRFFTTGSPSELSKNFFKEEFDYDEVEIETSSTSTFDLEMPFFPGDGVFLDNFGSFNDTSRFGDNSKKNSRGQSGWKNKMAYEDNSNDMWSPINENFHKHKDKGTKHGIFHPTAANVQNGTLLAFCGQLSKNYRDVQCYPPADAFNPCEDIMGRVTLRIGVWIVVIFAVMGNLAVMIVLLSSRFRMTVSKFLMVNLATADLCMGIYLLLIGAMDLHTKGVYFNFAIDWQNGLGCKIAGFLTVFASELSIFTLTIITTERWYAITYAINLNKRLKLSVAVRVMLLGWVYSIFMATLPLVGVSGYSKTSICLPMDTHDILSISYLVCLLVLNGLAFLVISACYVSMYCSISTHDAVATHSDLKVAKRMALLVFTDFACWAPIAFFGLTAVAGIPLISVSNAKILLVTFYPLNSCANPYLYAILTRQYRRDLFTLLDKYGVCSERTARSTIASPRSVDVRFKGSLLNNHPTHLSANSNALPAHRGSIQTQITICDFSRPGRSSFHSQHGTGGQSGQFLSHHDVTPHISPSRSSVKRLDSSALENDKLTTVKESSNSSENGGTDLGVHDNFYDKSQEINDSEVVADIASEDNEGTRLLPRKEIRKPEILVLKPKSDKLSVQIEDSKVDILSETEIKFSKHSNALKQNSQKLRQKDGYVAVPLENTETNEGIIEEDNDTDDGDEDDDEESKIIIEAGSPHPLKNCYTSLVVSQEQQQILDNALKMKRNSQKKKSNDNCKD